MVSKEIILALLLTSARKVIVSVMLFFFPLLLVEKSLTGLQIGLVVGVFAGSGILFSFHSGLASDRYSIRNVSFIGFFGLAIFYFLLSYADSFYEILFLFAIGGIAENLSDIALTSYVLKLTEDKNRGKNVGLYNFTYTFSAAVGFLIGGFIIYFLGFKTSLIIASMLSLLFSIFSIMLKSNDTFSFQVIDYASDFLRKPILIYSSILLLYTLHWGAEMTSYTLFLKHNLSLNIFQTGIFMSIPVVLLSITSFITGRMHDKGLEFNKIAFYGLLFSGLGHMLMVFGNVYFSFLMRIMHEIGDGIFLFYLFGAIHKHFPKNRLGGNTGFIMGVTTLGRIIGSLIFGLIGSIYGYQWPLFITGVIIILTMGVVKLEKN